MLFGEKYPDIVRVVSVGDFSKEFCGGTHLDNTGEVGFFKIVSEEGVSKGVRRIVAYTGQKAIDYIRERDEQLSSISNLLKISPTEASNRVEGLLKEIKDLKKKLAAGPSSGLSVEDLISNATDVDGVKLISVEIEGGTTDSMRSLIDQVRRKTSPVGVMLGSKSEGKVTLIAGLSRDLVDKGFNAKDWVSSTAKIVGGGGGGRPDMAQAGGKKPEKLAEALVQAEKTMKSQLDTAT